MKKFLVGLLSLICINSCVEDDPMFFTISSEVVPPEGGIVIPSDGYVEEGTEIMFLAVPAEHYAFKSWSSDAASIENPLTVIMNKDIFLSANFERLEYPLEVNVQGKGSVSKRVVPGKSTEIYPSGTTIQLEAISDTGWEFVRWYGGVESTENPIEFEMLGPMSIMCVFDFTNKEKVFIPDDNFETALIDLGLDDKMDDYVYVEFIKDVKELNLENRQIADLTGIEGFKQLASLYISNNRLTAIDISQNSYLDVLHCDGNELTELDVSNNLINALVATDNPLSCIHASSIQMWGGWTDDNWLVADEGVYASVDCSVTDQDRTYIPDDSFEQAIIDLGLDDVLDDYVKTVDILNLFVLDLSHRDISDMTGLEDFQGLLNLDISYNNITQLDVSNMIFLSIDVRNNPISCIQVNEAWLSTMGGGVTFIWADEGVEFSLDCNYSKLENID